MSCNFLSATVTATVSATSESSHAVALTVAVTVAPTVVVADRKNGLLYWALGYHKVVP